MRGCDEVGAIAFLATCAVLVCGALSLYIYSILAVITATVILAALVIMLIAIAVVLAVYGSIVDSKKQVDKSYSRAEGHRGFPWGNPQFPWWLGWLRWWLYGRRHKSGSDLVDEHTKFHDHR